MNCALKIISFLVITPVVFFSQIQQKSEYLNFNAGKLDSAERHAKLLELEKESITLKDKFHFKIAEAAVLNSENRVKDAITSFHQAIHISEELKNDSLKGVAYSRLGLMYMQRENLAKALLNTNKAIEFLKENAGDSNYVSLRHRKALIFSYLDQVSEYDKILPWLLNAAKIQPSRIIEANIYNTVGNCFLELNLPDSAIYYFEKSLSIREKIKNLPWIGQSYNNIGTASYNMGNYSKALKYFQQGLVWRMKGGANFSGIVESHINIGKTYFKLQNSSLANSYLTKAYIIGDSIGNLSLKQRAAAVLKEICIEKKDYKKALEYQNVYYAVNDSMYSTKKKDELINLTLDYETDQRLKEDSLRRVQAELEVKFEKDKQEAISKRTTIIIGLLILFLGVVAFFAYTFFKSNKQKQKQNELITSQHNLLQAKQTEINDSINYAKNIQNALLPSAEVFNEVCKEHFIFFRPRDVVSGDFYWATSVKDADKDLFIYITADCTGHGVPGAFMSLISISFLNEIINEEKILDPAEILNALRRKIIHALSQKEGEKRHDGLDGVVCVLNRKTYELTYSGANNKLYVFGKSYPELTEHKTNKMSVGKGPYEHVAFTKNTLTLSPNDIIYTFTDGYPDQFGGTTNKKLKTKNVQRKIITMAQKSLKEQGSEIESFFDEWKGNNDQVDDVAFIAVKV